MSRIELGLKTLPTQTIAAGGTAQPLDGGAPGTPNLVRQFVVQYVGSNTNDIFIGESDVTSGKCLVLNASNPTLHFTAEDTAGDEDNIYIDLNKVYIDGVTGEAVRVAYTSLEDKAYNS